MFKKSFSLCLLVFLCLLMFCPPVSQTYAADMYLNPTAGYPIMGDSTATGNVMTLKASGNVGIGTTGPTAVNGGAPVLHLSGANPEVNLNAITNGAGTSFNLQAKTSGGTTQQYFIGTNILTQTAGFEIYDKTQGASRVFIKTDGNVGIGTTEPAYKLELAAGGVARADTFRTGGSSYLDSARLLFTNGGGTIDENSYANTIFIGNDMYMKVNKSDGNFYIQTGGSNTRFYINSSGNVGIGTTAPSALLNLKGTLSSTLTGTVAVTQTSAAVVGTTTAFTTELAVGDSIKIGTEIFTVSVITDATNLTLDTTYAGTTASGLTAYRDPTLLAIDNGDAVNKLTITRSGYVGIGTTEPGAKLHIEGSSNGDYLKIKDTSNSNQDYTFATESTGSFYGLSLKNSAGNTIVNFDAGQKLGIATNNPTVPLDINASGADALQLRIGSYFGLGFSSVGQQRSIIGSSYGHDASMLSFTLGGFTTASDKMTILGTGNVGIGTTGPAHKLDVSGAMYSRRYGLTDGATIAVDWNNGNTQSVTLGDNRTFTFANGQDGGKYTLIIKQDATGSRTVTWPVSVRWSGGTSPTLTTTAAKTDYFGFIYNGVDAKYDCVAERTNF